MLHSAKYSVHLALFSPFWGYELKNRMSAQKQCMNQSKTNKLQIATTQTPLVRFSWKFTWKLRLPSSIGQRFCLIFYLGRELTLNVVVQGFQDVCECTIIVSFFDEDWKYWKVFSKSLMSVVFNLKISTF
jgi:hypothetical protein